MTGELGHFEAARRLSGQCADCRFARWVRSQRSVFMLCGRADEEGIYPKYPPLPVLRCSGYEPTSRDRE